MIRLIFTFLLLMPLMATSQSTEGTITYEEVLKMEIELPEEMKQYEHLIPKERKVKMDLRFSNKESIYAASKEVETAKENPFGGQENMVIQFNAVGAGNSAREVYTNLETKETYTLEDLMGKQFNIKGKLEDREWKVIGEQKQILGLTCIKAEMITDTITTTAWFTPQVPVGVGPSSFTGLPGAIMKVSVTGANPEISIVATKVNFDSLKDPVEKPKKGKEVSQEEFEEIQQKRIEEMEKMYGGSKKSGNTRIKIITN